jgi:hypothetical protein
MVLQVVEWLAVALAQQASCQGCHHRDWMQLEAGPQLLDMVSRMFMMGHSQWEGDMGGCLAMPRWRRLVYTSMV